MKNLFIRMGEEIFFCGVAFLSIVSCLVNNMLILFKHARYPKILFKFAKVVSTNSKNGLP